MTRAELISLDAQTGALLHLDPRDDVGSGEATASERNGEREIAIWKRGVTL